MWWLIGGQTLIGLSSPLTTGGVSIIANYWFADNERARATSLMLVSNPLGIFVSFLIQAVYSSQIKKEIDKSVPATTATKEGVQRMLLFETILTSIGVLYFWFVFRTSRPPSPPSLAATRRKQSITQGMWKDTKILIANRNFVLVLVVFSLVYSIYAGIGFVINPLLVPLGYSTT